MDERVIEMAEGMQVPTVSEIAMIADGIAQAATQEFLRALELRAANPGLQTSMMFGKLLHEMAALRATMHIAMCGSGMCRPDPVPMAPSVITEQ